MSFTLSTYRPAPAHPARDRANPPPMPPPLSLNISPEQNNINPCPSPLNLGQPALIPFDIPLLNSTPDSPPAGRPRAAAAAAADIAAAAAAAAAATPPPAPTLKPATESSTIMHIPSDVLSAEVFKFLPPAEINPALNSHGHFAHAAHARFARREIHVPHDITTINKAVEEVSFFVKHHAPHEAPTVVVGPGKHVLKGGLLLIDTPDIKIRGAGLSTKIVGRIRVEGGADGIVVEDLQIRNPRGAGVWVTGENSQMTLKHCRVSRCAGNGVYARQGSRCDLVDCEVVRNKGGGVAVWDPATSFKIVDSEVSKNLGDGVNVFAGAAVDVGGHSRVRSNSGCGLRTSSDDGQIMLAAVAEVRDNAVAQREGNVQVAA